MNGVPFVDPPPAIVHGYSARVLAVWLRAAWERGDFDALPAADRPAVAATIRAVEMAGEAWYRRRVSANTSDLGNLHLTPRKSHDDRPGEDVSTARAADMLGVTERRVRQLATKGAFGGRKVGNMWVLDAAAVATEVERKAAS